MEIQSASNTAKKIKLCYRVTEFCTFHLVTFFLPFQCQFYPWKLCLLHDYYCLDVSSPQVQTQLRKPVPKSQSYPSSPSWRRWWWWRRQRGRWWSSFVARYSRVIPYCSSETLHITVGFSPPLSEPPQKNAMKYFPKNYVSLVTEQVLEWFGDVKVALNGS